ncbi:putative D,D-dipeptide-binding periplasmic protein DdpA precursor [Roseovarius albus]|uniref:Putative D,D-dipeptide-binding periplasmic protein DdpA n=1 Tax=Roseovarius albus TaxID=1247867 RepID=A0A1X7A465_9RHOB|nr:ABC transporter substrate-binding protein [Roseovarius albus]SLN69721.1 putative D,D-dipeptide-binding periplasmic protein DdpA precursor [Roseovarius albus]
MTHKAQRPTLSQFHMPRRSFLAGSSALVALSTTTAGRAFADSQAAPPALGARDPKSLVVLVDAAVENLDPATNIEWAYGLRPIYETLTVLDGTDTLTVKPALATAWEANEDASSWTFTLAEGALFHDGTICDAEAIKKAVTRMVLHPAGLAGTWQLEDPETQIVVLDTHTIRFDLGEPRPFFDRQVSSQYGFWIASPTAAEANSKGDDDLGSEYLQSNPVGTGPFTLESLNPGQEAIFAADPGYRGGWEHDHFDRVITKTIPVSATRRQLLETGEADMSLALEPEDMLALRDDPRFTLSDTPTFTVQYVAFATDGILADPRARQAICHAFDHDAYIEEVILGTGDKPTSVFPSLMQGMDDKSRLLPFDLDRARALLAEAGIPEGTELTMAYYAGFGDIEGQLLQAWLSEIGINLQLQELSFSAYLDVFFGEGTAEERPDLFYFSWWPNVDHPYSFAWGLFSGDAATYDGNTGRYANEEATALIDAMRNQELTDEMAAKFQRLAGILTTEDPAWLPIMQERAQFVSRNDIAGIENNPIYVATLDMYNLSRKD